MPLGARDLRDRQPGGLPLDAPGDPVGQLHVRPRDLEVVVVLRVDRRQRRRVPGELEVLQRGARGLPGVVPALERGDHHRVDERGYGVVGTGARLAVGHRTSLRRRASGGGTEGPPVTFQGARRLLRRAEPAVRLPLPRRPPRACRGRRRGDGHHAAGCRRTRRPGVRRLRGPRGLQRDPQRHPPGRRRRHPPRLLRRGRGRRGDQHLRREPAQPRRLRHRGPDPGARREGGADRPGGGRRDVGAGPAAVRPRLGRPGHEAADAGPRVLRAAARRLHRVRPRADRRRQRRAGRRDLPGPAAGQGRGAGAAPGDGRRGPPRPDRHQRDGGDHRHDAPGQRDRGGADGDRAARASTSSGSTAPPAPPR